MEDPPRRLGTSQSEGNLSQSRLSDSRRQKLINLKAREDLKDALTSKFKMRFGHNAPHKQFDEVSVCSTTIRGEVDKFARLNNVTEANLLRLERRLGARAQGKVHNDDTNSIAGVSCYSGHSVRSRSSVSLAGQRVVNPLEGLPPTMDWTKLDEYAGYLHEQDCLRQTMGGRALQRKMKMDLDRQIEEKRKKTVDIKEEEDRHHQNSMLELERWKQMEDVRAAEKKQKLMKEKADRDEQLNFERKLRSEEQQKKLEEEANLVEKIVAEMEIEQAKFEANKEEVRKNMRKVFEDNQRDQEKRLAEDKAEREKDATALKEFARASQEEEERRKKELQDRLDKQTDLMKQLMSNVDTLKKGAGDNDAARALAQQEEMDRHFFEAENVKQDRLKQMRLENQAYLLRQMEEKEARKDDDKFLSDIQAQILGRDTEEYEEIERRKQIEKRIRNHEHRKDIEKQMEYKLRQSVPQMSENEMRMNKPLLHLVHKTLTNRDAMPPPMPAVDEEEDL